MIESLLSKISNIGNDKLLHFIYGAVIFSISFVFIKWFALALVAALALGKELYDASHTSNHTADLWDILATLAGAMVVALPLMF